MSVRDELVISLSKELMGPRRGRTEEIRIDPRHEYVVGILEPRGYRRDGSDDLVKKTNSDVRDTSDGKRQEIRGGHATEDESESELENNLLADNIDPRAFPKSMGMTFMLAKDEQEIDICATWARYKLDDGIWRRAPDFMVLQPCHLEYDKKVRSEKDGVEVEVSVHKMQDSVKFISIVIVNKRPQPEAGSLKTVDLLFQPQIRVSLGKESSLLPLPDVDVLHESEESSNVELNQEEENLALLYRDRTAYGRGLQCGILWREIDPESDSKKYKQYETPPYGWTDAATVDQQHRERYMHPDIRTEFFPVYSISSAEDNDSLKRFSALKLSTSFSSEFYMDGPLSKITDEYSKWIQARISEIEPEDKLEKIAVANMENSTMINERIKNGLKLLAENETARLAFCFMNKVMDKQSNWARKEPLEWRPFQIAFILMTLESIVDKSSPYRDYFDLLWYPTGGGKTEAYLGLAIFTMAFRRLGRVKSFDGVSVISRYTLRLLTIQQYRRALRAITAAEVLRTENWHPEGNAEEHLWGLSRFSIGLWVGESVAPNSLIGHEYRDQYGKVQKTTGAVDVLRNPRGQNNTNGDPAQILNCPQCNTILAISPSGISETEDMFWIVKSDRAPEAWNKEYRAYKAELVSVTPMKSSSYYSVQIKIVSRQKVMPVDINSIFEDFKNDRGAELACTHATFPGYFFKKDGSIYGKNHDFEIRCPNMSCELNQHEWEDFIPAKEGYEKNDIIKPFRINDSNVSHGIPITAYTVDEQIYHRCPSMIIATVDKIARLAFEPKGASIFGNVDNFDKDFGYYRNGEGNEPNTDIKPVNPFSVDPLPAPDLIIQDELHLIEGPLGTMVGIYEVGIDALSRSLEPEAAGAKYVGSTATIRAAGSQISSVFGRKLAQFPPNGISASDNFFARLDERHPRDDTKPGRLYMGICTPGTSAQTALKLIWSTLLQTPINIRGNHEAKKIDQFMTVVGYFNAIRELSAAVGLYRQDIHEWIKTRFKHVGREIGIATELSSRIDSRDLPNILDRLEKCGDDAIPGIFATSMFGTGVDIDRLGLMLVHGQPKTTSNYIQSTGRVGRTAGGLVVSYFRATRPRDLDHYEFFTRYHRSIQRYVEPVTVTPFSLRCLERAAGPVSVLMLRNLRKINNVMIDPGWCEERRKGKHGKTAIPSGSRKMQKRRDHEEVEEMINTFVERSNMQPFGRQLDSEKCRQIISSEIDKWVSRAKNHNDLLYWESPFLYQIVHNVVLGEDRHDEKNWSAYQNAPQSLRNVESITRFEG